MKKLTCILLVTMFTMTSMAFAQISGVLYDYVTITNRTTQESKIVSVDEFTSEGNHKFTYDVDFCLGVYKGDEIEITYTSRFYTTPRLSWSYSWKDGFSGDLGSAITLNLSVNDIPYNKSVLTVTCNYLGDGRFDTPKFYNICFKKVHKDERITVTPQPADKKCIIAYRYYNEVLSCIENNALVTLYKYPSGTRISRISFECIGDIGIAMPSTEGASEYIVSVTVNNKRIFTKTISLK